MRQPISWSPHTLAQLARRAGISEGRARGLYAAMQAGGSASGLPRPDHTDADGRPLWWAATIDSWCVRTGREVDDDALWVFQAPSAARPVAELRRGVVTLEGRGGGPHPFYAIVWDTEAGHLVYLQPLGETGGQSKDWLAVYAAQLLEPRWWGSAVVVMPVEDELAFFPQYQREPICYVYRLRAENSADADERVVFRRGVGSRAGGRGAVERKGEWRGVRRWLGRAERAEPVAPVPRAEWVTHVDLADIARVVGCPMPAWIGETTTVANVERTLSFGDRTFTAVDTVTDWPQVQDVLASAVKIGLPGEYPAGFAALAVDAADELDRIRTALSNTPEVGVGWYLVCRPARPAPPIELEQRIVGARRVTDIELVGKELSELRVVEGGLDIDDPHGEVYAKTIEALAGQLRETARDAAKQAGSCLESGAYVPIADDELQRFSAPWVGPVVDAWRKTLVAVDDLPAVLRLRRVRRILRSDSVEQVQAAYRDHAGRYVLVVARAHGTEWFIAEWPTTLAATSSWTEETMLAGDDRTTVTALLALTSTDDGGMRVDPVPLPPHCDRDAFAYGYSGGSPATTYSAVLRVALGDNVNIEPAVRRSLDRGPDRESISQLRRAIETTNGPLRLSWPQVKLWARADAARATTPSVDPVGGSTS